MQNVKKHAEGDIELPVVMEPNAVVKDQLAQFASKNPSDTLVVKQDNKIVQLLVPTEWPTLSEEESRYVRFVNSISHDFAASLSGQDRTDAGYRALAAHFGL